MYPSSRRLNINSPFEVSLEKCLGDLIRSNAEVAKTVCYLFSDAQPFTNNKITVKFSNREIAEIVGIIHGTSSDAWYCSVPRTFDYCDVVENALAKEGWIITTPY